MIRSRLTHRRVLAIHLLTLAALFASLLVAIAGCGASGTAATAAGTGGSTSVPGPIVKSNDSVTNNGGSEEIVTAKFPVGRDTDEVSVSGTKPIKPCVLVTAEEANHILGGNVKKTERPQGPTCVFTGSGRQVTLTVTQTSLNSLVKAARSAKSVTVRGRKGWCLRYQSTSVVIGVGRGRVLQVTGPCAAGVQFAAAALPRIP
ncbi:MAG: hypothetical protein QOH18_396 [Solirubrobacterales bacterium]|jgi:hypothetical protein|nr:hypothetical protein [Solirubrobacterales bacterium]